MPQLLFLGSGDSQGVPRWWCHCDVCHEARLTGHNARTRPSVLIKGEKQTLIDASPELRLQMTRQANDDIDSVLITHAHNDHILGLGDVADKARWTQKQTAIYTPESVLLDLSERFSYFKHSHYPNLIPMIALPKKHEVENYVMAHYKVPHGANGFAYAFKFESATTSWAYMPDSIGLKTLEPWQNLDLLILGTSFYKEDAAYDRRSVYDVSEALELLRILKPKQTVFTHLGHGVDSRQALPEGLNVQYAFDGLMIDLPM